MKTIFAIFISFLPLLSFSQAMNKEVKAKIEIAYSEDLILIKGTAENLTTVFKSISYKLSVIKNGGREGNQSTNSQSGREALEPEKIKDLSKTQINSTSQDNIVILLLLFDENGTIIGKDRIALGEKKKLETQTSKVNDGLELTGIVSDETKTKNGKDFYDLFYSEYNKVNQKGTKIVTVTEELTLARNTKLVISVDSEVLSEFVLKPDEEYLTFMAQESATAVFKYFKNLERQSQQIIRY